MKLVSPDGEYELDTESEDVDAGQVLTAKAKGWATKEQHAANAKADDARAKAAAKADEVDADKVSPKTTKGKA